MPDNKALPEKLKECPFCGGDAEKFEINDRDPLATHLTVCISCKTCHAKSHRKFNYGRYTDSDLQFAINLWNARV